MSRIERKRSDGSATKSDSLVSRTARAKVRRGEARHRNRSIQTRHRHRLIIFCLFHFFFNGSIAGARRSIRVTLFPSLISSLSPFLFFSSARFGLCSAVDPLVLRLRCAETIARADRKRCGAPEEADEGEETSRRRDEWRAQREEENAISMSVDQARRRKNG